jgi:peptidyl-prolyl isomerase D
MASTSSLERSLGANQSAGIQRCVPFQYSHMSVSIVRQIERLPTSSGDVPKDPVVIIKSGVLEATDQFLTQENTSVDGDKYEDYPEDGDVDVQNPEIALSVAKEIKDIGSKLFKEGNAREALLKYQSTWFCSASTV